MRKTTLLLLAMGLLALAASAVATHQLDHRFHVQGAVVDSFGMPAMFVRVEAVDLSDPSVGTSAGTTGFDGRYDVIVHLHNTNLGDQVQVSVAGQTTIITAQFDPSDTSTERYSPNSAFTIPPGANLVPYVLIAIAIVVPIFFLVRRYAPMRGVRLRPRGKLGIDAISGIGRAREKELKALGINSLEKLADAEAAAVADQTSFTLKEAKRVVRRARALVEEEGPPT